MATCRHFSLVRYTKRETCHDKRHNFGGLDELPCCIQNQGDCEGHELREKDKVKEWAPAGQGTYEEVIRRSQRTFGDNPNKEKTE